MVIRFYCGFHDQYPHPQHTHTQSDMRTACLPGETVALNCEFSGESGSRLLLTKVIRIVVYVYNREDSI